SFNKLKSFFTIEPVLIIFNSFYIIIIEIDSSGYIIREVLSQFNNKRILQLYIYFLKKNLFTEYNYKIYNKKLLAVI
ncbi:hypothetical protein BO71DRAFT_337640, partial [Aspergillus ellipticus CBS 707.79]